MGQRYVVANEEIERHVHEIENKPARRIAAELKLSRDLVSELRRAGYLPARVRLALSRIPKQSDRTGWDVAAGVREPEVPDEPITDTMREDFE